MTYTVKEIFYSIQGEGAQAGRAAVFLRFSGCNLWSGLEKDRSTAVCKLCDTEFVGVGPDGGKFIDAESLVAAVDAKWPKGVNGTKFVVCTGGEPLLQLDGALIGALKERQFEVAVETNGTITAPSGIDWLCVSPKAGSDIVQKTGNELKVVYPQDGLDMEELEAYSFNHHYLQPLYGQEVESNTRKAIAYCMSHPKWYFSIQSHKVLGIR